jgi:GR25 family glycosyltransferase involved in LPS biosynthesis
MLFPWKIYIVSVKECGERRRFVEHQKQKLESYGFQVEIIDAIYWKTTNVMDRMNQLGIDFLYHLSQTQIACFLSHRMVWQKIVDCQEKYTIVLEDDIDLADFDLFLQSEKEVSTLDSFHGLIFWKHPEKVRLDTEKISKNLIKAYEQWGTCAYHLSPKICAELLEISQLTKPIDNYLYNDIFPAYNNIFMTERDPFINIGLIENREVYGYTFKSLIMG